MSSTRSTNSPTPSALNVPPPPPHMAPHPPPAATAPTPTINDPSKSTSSRTYITDKIDIRVTGDKTRDQCLGLLYDALVVDDTQTPPKTILSVVQSVEQTVFKMSQNRVDPTYRTKIRTLRVNLRDDENPVLRKDLRESKLSAQRLCTMTPQEMASEQRRAGNKKLEEENLFKAQGAKEVKAITDRFQCGKCKQRKVSYFQMQTRSADEPMTSKLYAGILAWLIDDQHSASVRCAITAGSSRRS